MIAPNSPSLCWASKFDRALRQGVALVAPAFPADFSVNVFGVKTDCSQQPQSLRQNLSADSISRHCDYRVFRHKFVLRFFLYASPSLFATKFSAPPAITSDCGTLPNGGKTNVSPRQVIVPEVKSISTSSPGMMVFSFATISSQN